MGRGSPFGVGEALRGAEEAGGGGRQQDELAARRLGLAGRAEAVFEDLDDALDAPQLEVEGAPAGDVDAGAAVLVREAQELLRLAELGPREGSGEQLLGEAADVLAHAVTDAVLGAAGMGDIGQHFPDTDPAFRGADSLALLREAVARVGGAGWRVEFVDATVMMERPKVAPHREAIMAALSDAVGAPVHVKATTGEGMGFVGREEGVAALAVATLSRE